MEPIGQTMALFLLSMCALLSVGSLATDEHRFPDQNQFPYHVFGANGWYDRKYGRFSDQQRTEGLRMARHMFQFGYDSYMKYAFPKDELNPIDCNGRGPDVDNPSNININDVLGDYSLTLYVVISADQ